MDRSKCVLRGGKSQNTHTQSRDIHTRDRPQGGANSDIVIKHCKTILAKTHSIALGCYVCSHEKNTYKEFSNKRILELNAEEQFISRTNALIFYTQFYLDWEYVWTSRFVRTVCLKETVHWFVWCLVRIGHFTCHVAVQVLIT